MSVQEPIYLALEGAREEQRKIAKYIRVYQQLFITGNEMSPFFEEQFLERMENENERLLGRIRELEREVAILAESFELLEIPF